MDAMIAQKKQAHKRCLMKRLHKTVLFLITLSIFLPSTSALAIRLKDIASTTGVRENQLIGYGLVVGLNGTGDGNKAGFTTNGIVNMMEQMGIHLNPTDIKVKNVAGVMVTAQLLPFAKAGQRIDVLLSSLGDAKSLQGGTLMVTPLKGLDGKVYAIAQGPIAVGGFAAAGGGASVQKNHPTVARIPDGATVEREVPVAFASKEEIIMSLNAPDFTTTMRTVSAINKALDGPFAKAKDGATLAIEVPDQYKGNTVSFMAMLESLNVTPDVQAKVVLDERTGTVVMGEGVRISQVAVSHGNLSLQIRTTDQTVSQPLPLSAGQTTVTTTEEVSVQEGKNQLVILQEGPTMNDVVRALNSVGVSPRDLIAIFHSIKAAGALQADLEII